MAISRASCAFKAQRFKASGGELNGWMLTSKTEERRMTWKFFVLVLLFFLFLILFPLFFLPDSSGFLRIVARFLDFNTSSWNIQHGLRAIRFHFFQWNLRLCARGLLFRPEELNFELGRWSGDSLSICWYSRPSRSLHRRNSLKLAPFETIEGLTSGSNSNSTFPLFHLSLDFSNTSNNSPSYFLKNIWEVGGGGG